MPKLQNGCKGLSHLRPVSIEIPAFYHTSSDSRNKKTEVGHMDCEDGCLYDVQLTTRRITN